MALISDPTNTRSVFPNNLDSFANKADGVSINNVIDAEIWNKINTAILRCQEHTQKIVHYATDGSRKRLILQTTTVVASTPEEFLTTFTLNTNQMAFLGNDLARPGNFFIASAYKYSGNEAYFTNIALNEPNQVIVRTRRIPPSSDVQAGTYFVRLTILGL
jgi:hypothetical protein